MSNISELFGGIPHLSLEELLTYLPSFVAECDLQVGEWVLIMPARRKALLGPLIQLWEGQELGVKVPHLLSDPQMSPKRYALNRFVNDVDEIRLAPLSVSVSLLCSTQSAEVSDSFRLDQRPLYLHVRLGLLTNSRPSVFGGDDNIEAITIQRGSRKPEKKTLCVPALCTFTRRATSCPEMRVQKRQNESFITSTLDASFSWKESIKVAVEQEWIKWKNHHWGG